MKRTTGYVLVSLGLILIFLAPLLKFYTVPRVKKIPTDFYNREVAVGTGIYLDPGQNFAVVGPVAVQDVRIQKGDPPSSTSTVAVWDGFDSLFDTENNHQITYSINRYTLNRTSALSVNCCGQNEDRTGNLTQLFPIGTQKKTYPFWDDNAKQGMPIDYMKETELFDTPLWLFHQSFPATQINTLSLPGSLLSEPDQATVKTNWMYSAETYIWVEPNTGGIVKAAQHAYQWLADPSTGASLLTVADINAAWDDPTVQAAVNKAVKQRDQLKLLETTIPIVAPIIGIVLALIGFLLLRSKPKSAPVAEPVETEVAA